MSYDALGTRARPTLGLDTFGDVTAGPDGRRLSDAEVIRHVVDEAVLADRLGLRGPQQTPDNRTRRALPHRGKQYLGGVEAVHHHRVVGGSAPLAAVLEARRAVLALRLQRIDVELETARAWARLEFLIPDQGALR